MHMAWKIDRNRNACHLTHFIFVMNLGFGPAKIQSAPFPTKKKSILSLNEVLGFATNDGKKKTEKVVCGGFIK